VKEQNRRGRGQVERSLDFDDPSLACELFGPRNANLEALAARSEVDLQSRGNLLMLRAENEEFLESAAEALIQLYGLLKAGHPVFPRDVLYAYDVLRHDPKTDLKQAFRQGRCVVSPRKTIVPRTVSQREYLDVMRRHDMVFCIGPAGTGKTYLAVAMALSSLLDRRVKRIVLTRPAVEAGEKLGFLPGDMQEKVNPYLRPLYDALHDMYDVRKVQEMMESGIIEVAPLAFMRGRSLDESFIILDEAQNTTPEQMKMFLTRMGFGSKAVITGDVTQIDLPMENGRQGPRSGLVQACDLLADVEGLGFCKFTEQDVIRHPLVGRIVQAYERYANASQKNG
jgi:phosphate starvation-inducible protein PhoH and related proteins